MHAACLMFHGLVSRLMAHGSTYTYLKQLYILPRRGVCVSVRLGLSAGGSAAPLSHYMAASCGAFQKLGNATSADSRWRNGRRLMQMCLVPPTLLHVSHQRVLNLSCGSNLGCLFFVYLEATCILHIRFGFGHVGFAIELWPASRLSS